MVAASLLGGAVAVMVGVILLLLCSVLISMGVIGQNAQIQAVIAACVLGGFCGGRVTGRKWKGRSLLAGLSARAVFLLILLLVGLLGYGSDLDLNGGSLGVMAGCLCGGAAAGLLGNRKGKKKKRTY
jgi:putative membrane protein (TIGR04086 family)